LFLEASNLERAQARKVSRDRFLTENFLNVSTSHLTSSPITSLGKVTGWILLTSSVLYALFHYDAYFLCFLSHGNTNSLLDCVISDNEGKISNHLFYFCVFATFINIRSAYILSSCRVAILIFANNGSCCFISLRKF
jgi:hypothetical protein